MPLEIDCPACLRKFRVPDSAAGKKIRCPKCQGAIEVPGRAAVAVEDASKPALAAGSGREWYLKDEEGNNYGPVSRAALDQWLTDGRITADCQLLAVGSQQWQWASDVYPELEDEADEEEDESAEPATKVAVDETQPAWSPAGLSIGPAKSAASPAIEMPAPIVTRRAPVTTKPKLPKAPAKGDEDSRSSRSKVVASVLGIFLGSLGTHRFYLGYWGMGLAMLFTLGGCGVWSLIDAVCVILGRVPDADGRPLSD